MTLIHPFQDELLQPDRDPKYRKLAIPNSKPIRYILLTLASWEALALSTLFVSSRFPYHDKYSFLRIEPFFEMNTCNMETKSRRK